MWRCQVVQAVWDAIMLDQLTRSEGITRIFVLNRNSTNSQKRRTAESFIEKGLGPSILDEAGVPEIVYLGVDFSRSNLGLRKEDYGEITQISLSFNIGIFI